MRNKFKRKIKKALDKISSIESAHVVAYFKYPYSDHTSPVYLSICSINKTEFDLRLKSGHSSSLYALDPECEKTQQKLIEANLKISDMKQLEEYLYSFKHTKWIPVELKYKRRLK